jgi:hypothetical protein
MIPIYITPGLYEKFQWWLKFELDEMEIVK